jgi:xylan 1,4-beta-xylosidase
MNRRDVFRSAALLPVAAAAASASQQAQQGSPASLKLDFARKLGPMQIERVGLGQGGLSPNPMWDDRAVEIRALNPGMIRLFVQEYFDLLPERGRYHFDTLDRSVDVIRSTGATPLLSIAFKPKVLFPEVNQDIVEPNDYQAWEELIYRVVLHHKERGSGIRYWEVSNEPDIGEDGGCPYRFKPDSYVRYYEHTVRAALKADPSVRVGGPALANVKSPILPALLEAANAGRVPLHFISWHIYNSSPQQIRDTIAYADDLLRKYPKVRVERHLNEWNMSLSNPVLDPRFQPCFVLETAWHMQDAGLDWSCYYHIRDYYVDRDRFAKFMSPRGAAFMARWWNRMPQFDGLFDYQNTVRPAYWSFKLLSRLTGEKLSIDSSHPKVRAMLTWDESYDLFNLLFWNFSDSTVPLKIDWSGLPHNVSAKRMWLDAATASNIENDRLRPLPAVSMPQGAGNAEAELAPWGIQYWYLERGRA